MSTRALARALLVADSLVALALLLAFPGAGQAAGPTYRILDLGTLGGSSSKAYALNDSEVVVGMSLSSGSVQQLRAVRWVHGAIADLGTLGGSQAEAYAVDPVGVAVGYATNGDGVAHAFRRDGSGMEDLGTLGGSVSYAYGVTASGMVVGTSAIPGDIYTHAFLRSAGGSMTDLGTISGGTRSYAYAVDESGWVVGHSHVASGDVHAFLRTPGSPGLLDLGTLGGSNSYATALYQDGPFQIVGSSQTTGNTAQHACYWDNYQRIQDMGSLGGTYATAYAINRRSEVVGTSTTSGGAQHAFYWSGTGALQDLNSFVPPDSDWVLVEARGINYSGSIAGWGLHHGATRAFLLQLQYSTGVGGRPQEGVSFRGPRTNPMSSNTMLDFELPSACRVQLDLYDVLGRRLRGWDAQLGPGAHALAWDGRDGAGRPVGSGMYWARLRAAGVDLTRRVTVIR
ncbi:MAG TPA: hypothetical protein VMS93_12345 [Candidatus Saccharimonadales bacterium]|nr:hypothetical protein [Candidatus Saccharimonadales bacterium]